MSIRQELAIFTARLARLAAKMLRRGGTSLPGEIALKIDPHLPQKLLAGQELILVSGTNGKTSTVHFLATLCRGLGYEVIANWSGANLVYGITAAVLAAPAPTAGQKRIYIFEIDEAHLAKYAVDLNPRHIILTNLHADQSDRYGSVRELRQKLAEGLRSLGSSTHFYLPSADPELAYIGREHRGTTHYFGRELRAEERAQWEAFCAELRGGAEQPVTGDCQESLDSAPELRYAWHEYGEHGGFASLHSDLSWSEPDLGYQILSAEKGDYALLYNHLQGEGVASSDQPEPVKLQLEVPGEHNLINATAALLPLLVDGYELSELLPKLREARAPFGRMERFHLKTHEGMMILVKNPVGLETGLREAAKQEGLGSLILMVNKRVNDGTDDSWLREARLPEFLAPLGDLPIIVAGESAGLIHEILTAAAVPHSVAADERAAFREALEISPPGSTLLFLPNYSAMIDFRKILAEDYEVPDFWAEG